MKDLPMDQQPLLAAAHAEYMHLQKTVEDFDSKAMTIKAWSISFSLTVLVGGFVSKAATVFMVAAIASLLFWTLECLWKAFQLGYYERIAVLEAFFRGDAPLVAPCQIYTAWMARWHETTWTEVARTSLWPHVALPHAVVVALGLLLYLLSICGLMDAAVT